MNDLIEQAKTIDGWMSETELAWLYEAARKCRRVVEVGSYAGRSSFILAQAVMRHCGYLVCIDPWQRYNSCTGYEIDADRAEFSFDMVAQSLPILKIKDRSLNAVQSIDTFFDMVFLDGDHHYEALYNEIEAWSKRIRPHGLICGHDYSENYPGVRRAVDELLPHRQIIDTIWFSYLQ